MTNFSPISVPVKRLIFVAYLFQGTTETVVEGNNSGVCFRSSNLFFFSLTELEYQRQSRPS